MIGIAMSGVSRRSVSIQWYIHGDHVVISRNRKTLFQRPRINRREEGEKVNEATKDLDGL